ncbi:MAG TPA: polyprenyl synthetase family protein [Candidatus Eisenbacteria bacterium]|jgi:geranylgeranyl diphosphate synthase type II
MRGEPGARRDGGSPARRGERNGAPRAASASVLLRRLASRRRAFERYFGRALASRCAAPGALGKAIRYAALSPGKRLRPLLALAACEAVGGRWQVALPAAAAVESVHAFSLVHDDLPALDDDDYRRGRLTTHKKFGEAVAILAGDALLAFAFEELARLERGGVRAGRVVEAVSRLAHASGGERLVGGQALDLAAEGRRVSRRAVAAIHWNKTGALMGAALALGAIAGGARVAQVTRLEEAGGFLGTAFQVQDDLLNAGSSLRRLGKRGGTDAARGKATFLRAAGEARSRNAIETFLDLAKHMIAGTCRRPRSLLLVVEAMASRER